MDSFRETIRRLRARAGHASARGFHRRWRAGDPGTCGYKAYCEMEAGRLIPSPALAARLAAALRLQPGAREAEAFRASYLFSLTRSASLARTLIEALRPQADGRGLVERALNAGLSRRRQVLTAAQCDLVMEDPAARLCFTVLHACARAWTPEEMASVLGLDPSRSAAALKRLQACGLARRRQGVYSYPYADRNAVFPRPTESQLRKVGNSFFVGLPETGWVRPRNGPVPRPARRLAAHRSTDEPDGGHSAFPAQGVRGGRRLLGVGVRLEGILAMSLRDIGAVRRVSRLLRACRQTAGYASPRAFYDAAGGRALLGCDYSTYRRLEGPGRLHKPATFEKIHSELSTACEPKLLRALSRAYARALLGEEIARWPSPEAAPCTRGSGPLPVMPAGSWDKAACDPHLLAGLLALESGRASAGELPGPLPRARRALEHLIRVGMARRAAGACVPVPRAFPAARSSSSACDRGRLLSGLAAAAGARVEVVGGVTAFVQSDREDMDDFFRHLWGAAAPLVRGARAQSKGDAPVHLLEVVIRERIILDPLDAE